MPNNSTERYRVFKNKLKEDYERYNYFKSKDKVRKRTERSTVKVQNNSEIERKKKLNRDRVRKCRALKKSVNDKQEPDADNVERAYGTPQALGKAVGKVKPYLPKSPRKRKAVITKLACSTGIPLAKRKTILSGGNKSLSPEVVKKVQSYYKLDSISRQSPGRKDFVVCRQNGKKQHSQKRHLLFSLREVHALFLKDNPTINIGLSKFCSLRPANVLLSSEMPRNACCCMYHENVKLICECLSKEINEFPSYSGEFVNNFVCNPDSEECMLGKCTKCPSWLQTFTSLEDSPVTWYEWERIDVLVSTKGKKAQHKTTKRLKKMCKEGTVSDVLESLKTKLPFFLQHVFIKRKQSRYFEETLSNLNEEECAVQVDFAENYSCAYQDEIQTAHWSQTQVTLFTVAVWTKAKGDRVCESYVIVSDDTDHDKKSVAAFLWHIINEFVMKKHPNIKYVYAFSDGPSSQFKNRYIVNFLHKIKKIVSIQWNYFATSHGKGVVDGIGGTVKRRVWNAVLTRKAPSVQDAQSFHRVACSLSMSVTVSLMMKKEINDIFNLLHLEKCFSEAQPVHGISKFHCIEPTEGQFVNCRLYSSQPPVQNRPPDVYPYDSDESDISDSETGYTDTDDNKETDDDKDVDYDHKSNLDTEEEDSGSRDGCKLETEESNYESTDEDVVFVKETSAAMNDSSNNISSINVCHGIEQNIAPTIKNETTCVMQSHREPLLNCLLNGSVKFKGSGIIDEQDIKGLVGDSHADENNYLSNFVIDEYLKIIAMKGSTEGVKTVSIGWEIFEKGPTKDLLQGKALLDQDIILVPCITGTKNSKHWFLLACKPKENN